MAQANPRAQKYAPVIGAAMNHSLIHTVYDLSGNIGPTLVFEYAANAAHSVCLIPFPHTATRRKLDVQMAIRPHHCGPAEMIERAPPGGLAELESKPGVVCAP